MLGLGPDLHEAQSAVYRYLGARFGIDAPTIPPLADLIRESAAAEARGEALRSASLVHENEL